MVEDVPLDINLGTYSENCLVLNTICVLHHSTPPTQKFLRILQNVFIQKDHEESFDHSDAWVLLHVVSSKTQEHLDVS